MKKDKKGWIRIVEAVAAILLLTSVVIVFASRATPKTDPSAAIYTLQRAILDDLSRNETMRIKILSSNPDSMSIKEFLKTRLPAGFNFNYSICPPSESCFNPTVPQERNVYVDDAIISPTATFPVTKKFTFFVWIE